MRRRIGLGRQPRRRRPDLQRHVARGIELFQERRRADAHRPVLVRQRASQDRLRRGRAVLDERAERRRARDVRRVALARLVRRGQRRRAAGRLELAETGGRRDADRRIFGLQALDQHRRHVRVAKLDQRRQHRRNDALIAVLEHRRQARQRDVRRQRAEHRRERRPHDPVGIGIEAGEHGDEVFGILRRAGAERGRTDIRARVRHEIEQDVVDGRCPDPARRGDRFETQMRLRLPVLHDLQQRGRRGWIADAAERPHRLDRDRPFGAHRQRDQERDGRRAGAGSAGEPPSARPAP